MRTVPIFLDGDNQSVRLPEDMVYPGVTELIIEGEGDVTTLRPVRPTWRSFFELPPIEDHDFLKTASTSWIRTGSARCGTA